MDEGFLGNIIAGLIDKNNNGDGFGNGGWWILLVLLLFGGGMWGNRGMGTPPDVATQGRVDAGFQFNQLASDNRSIERSIANTNYDNLAQIQRAIDVTNGVGVQVQNARYDLSNQLCGTNHNIDNLRYDMAQLGCGINKNIDTVRYDMSLNTCRLQETSTANAQKILDKLCQMESDAKDNTIAQLRQDLQAAQLTLGNNAQTQTIVGALRPTPIPAYITSSPYTSYSGCTGTTVL